MDRGEYSSHLAAWTGKKTLRQTAYEKHDVMILRSASAACTQGMFYTKAEQTDVHGRYSNTTTGKARLAALSTARNNLSEGAPVHDLYRCADKRVHDSWRHHANQAKVLRACACGRRVSLTSSVFCEKDAYPEVIGTGIRPNETRSSREPTACSAVERAHHLDYNGIRLSPE